MLDHDIGLKAETSIEAPILVAVAGVAVDAAMLTTLIRVDRVVQRQVGTVVFAEGIYQVFGKEFRDRLV